MTHHLPTADDALPTSPFQGVNDREIHREIATADLFYDSAHTAPAKNFSKPLPSSKSASPSDSNASGSLPPHDKLASLMDEAPLGELGDTEKCESCLSCKKAKRAVESWTQLDEFTCACEDVPNEGGADAKHHKSDTEAGLGMHWSLASNPRATNGAKGFGLRSGSSDGTADIWTGAPKH